MKKKIIYFISSAAFIFCLSNFLTLADAQRLEPNVVSIDATEANQVVRRQEGVLIDVRERNEAENGMASIARWMPLSKMENDDLMYVDFLNHLPKDKLIIIYCASGNRAKKAQRKLEDRGYRTANMGAFSKWKDAGLPIRKLEKYE